MTIKVMGNPLSLKTDRLASSLFLTVLIIVILYLEYIDPCPKNQSVNYFLR